MKATYPTTVTELLAHPRWDGFIADRLGNELFLNDPDRADRCYEAAEDGCDGSTHAEHITDWREFAELLYGDEHRAVWDDDQASAALAAASEALEKDITRCESFHKAAGTLHEQVG